MIHSFQARLNKLVPKIELASLGAGIPGSALFYAGIPLGRALLSIGMYSLAGVFFLKAYLPPITVKQIGPGGFRGVLYQLLWQVLHIASAVSTIGFLFFLLREKGFVQIFWVGSGSLMICMAILVMIVLGNGEYWPQLRSSVLKAGALLLAGVYILLTNPA